MNVLFHQDCNWVWSWDRYWFGNVVRHRNRAVMRNGNRNLHMDFFFNTDGVGNFADYRHGNWPINLNRVWLVHVDRIRSVDRNLNGYLNGVRHLLFYCNRHRLRHPNPDVLVDCNAVYNSLAFG